jgi:hypothetical protein
LVFGHYSRAQLEGAIFGLIGAGVRQ